MTNLAKPSAFSALVLVATLTGCAAEQPDFELGCAQEALRSENGIATNAISFNSLGFNAITYNAITYNAITYNAISYNAIAYNVIGFNAITFNAIGWNGGDAAFESSAGVPEFSCQPQAFKAYSYMVGCALRPEQSVDVVVDGVSQTVHGALGLAPEWVEGPCDEACQQWVSACLIARVNARGEQVEISLRGNHPNLAVGPDEAETFSQPEASYYGNVFGQEPVASACLANGVTHLERVCGDDADCPVKVQGFCAEVCDERGCRAQDGSTYPVISVYRKSEVSSPEVQ